MRQSAQAWCALPSTCSPCGGSGCVDGTGLVDPLTSPANPVDYSGLWYTNGGTYGTAEYDGAGNAQADSSGLYTFSQMVVPWSPIFDCCPVGVDNGFTWQFVYEGGYVACGAVTASLGGNLTVNLNWPLPSDSTFPNEDGVAQSWTRVAVDPAYLNPSPGDTITVAFDGTTLFYVRNGVTVAEYDPATQFGPWSEVGFTFGWYDATPGVISGPVIGGCCHPGDGPAALVSPCSDGLLAGTVLIDENGAPLLTEGGECIDVPTADAVALTYSSQGDTNGLIHYLGTNGGTTAFANPSGPGGLVVMAGPGLDNGYSAIYNGTDEDDNTDALVSGVGQYWGIDLGPNRTIAVDTYTMRSRHDSNEWAQEWVLEGRNDTESAWTTIDSQAAQNFGAAATWKTYSPGDTTAYRMVRFRFPTDTDNVAARNMFSRVEFYGTLYEWALPTATGVDLTDTGASDHGLRWHLGTVGGTEAYTDAWTRGKVEAYTHGYTGGYTAYDWLAATNDCILGDSGEATSDNWLKIDLGPNSTFVPTAIAMKRRATGAGGGIPGFLIEGSNDDSTWTEITRYRSASVFYAYNNRYVFPLDYPAATPWRYLRMTVLEAYIFPGFNTLEWFGYYNTTTPTAVGTLHMPNNPRNLDDVIHNHTLPTVTASSIASGAAGNTVDGVTGTPGTVNSEAYTGNVASSWFEFDFGAAQIRPEGFSYYSRDNWYLIGPLTLEGWNGSAWETIRSVDPWPADSPPYPGVIYDRKWAFWWLDSATYYSKFRLTQTGTNGEGSNIFVLNELVLWGDYVP